MGMMIAHQDLRPRLLGVPQPLPESPVLARKIEALRELPMFADATSDELLRLAESSLLRRFERGRTICRGGSGDECVLLVKGRAKTILPRGSACGEFALGILEANDIVSEACWSAARTRDHGETIAIEECLAAFLPRRSLEQLFFRNPKVTLRFVTAVAAKLHRVVDLAMQNACLDVGDRLYRKLVELATKRGRWTDEGLLIDHGLYQAELAAGIGASREAVNRQLAQWRAKGLVEAGRRRVLVKDPMGLKMAASRAVREEEFQSDGLRR